MSLAFNLAIFLITAAIMPRVFRKDGAWSLENSKTAFRFFTVQSNVFCAVSALLMCLFPHSRAAWLIKYAGTAAVIVTMLTVLFHLGPLYGYKKLLSGSDLFMHLITPILALVSFCVFEKRGLAFWESLWGLAPVALYGALYMYRVVFAPKDKAWDDFYGFNQTGKFYIAAEMMLAGTFLICMGLMGLQNM
uniref:Uncharacterized protein n=1 Tax=uncultured bacterium Contig17 TaxID=1393492 RepID=W0FND0_9BACT|nr:hypothetical protein [uncultured bacterium Contig17]